MSRNRTPRLLGAALCVSGCGGAPERALEAHEAVAVWVEPAEVQTATAGVAELAWQTPGECTWVYAVEASYDNVPFGQTPKPSLLAIGPAPRDSVRRGDGITRVRIQYEGEQAAMCGTQRDGYADRSLWGPASPTAACTPKTWDPVEDALTLGFPQLPPGMTTVGSHFRGARVEGRCNKTACIHPEKYTGGVDGEFRTCTTMSWDEELVGLYDIGGERYAAIIGRWHDGHGEQGIHTERRVLMSLRHGRPVWAQAVVHHAFPQPIGTRPDFGPITRTWTMRAVDRCGGSLVDHGLPVDPWSDAEVARIAKDLAEDPEARRVRCREARKAKLRAKAQAERAAASSAEAAPAGDGGRAGEGAETGSGGAGSEEAQPLREGSGAAARPSNEDG